MVIDISASELVSVLYREPKLLKALMRFSLAGRRSTVSVLYREPKLLKATFCINNKYCSVGFSALP